MNVVEATVVKRCSSEACPDCEEPLIVVDPVVELGTVLRVDLDTRRTQQMFVHRRLHPVEVVEVVEVVGRPDLNARGDDNLVPVELLMRNGSAL